MSGSISDGRRRSARVHAGRSWTCVCGRVVWGNGGKSSHKRACRPFNLSLLKSYESVEADHASGRLPDRGGWRRTNQNRLAHERALMAAWPEGARRPAEPLDAEP